VSRVSEPPIWPSGVGGVDPEFLYEREGGKTWCIVHIDADVRALLADLVGGAQSPLPPLELPGTWEEADFLGGAPDTYQ
jgi:hypothetical protein